MTELFKHYGPMILALSVAVIIFTVVFGTDSGTSVFKMASDTGKIENESVGDNTGMNSYYNKEAPVISFSQVSASGASLDAIDVTYNLNDFFSYTCASGVTGQGMEIMHVTRDGDDMELITDTNKVDHFVFPESGLYLITVKATDEEKRVTRTVFRVPIL